MSMIKFFQSLSAQPLRTISRCNRNPLSYFLNLHRVTSQCFNSDATSINPTTTTNNNCMSIIVTSSSPQKRLFHAVEYHTINYSKKKSFFWNEISSAMMGNGSMLLGQSPNHPNEGRRRHFVVVTNTSSSDLSTKSKTDTKPKMKKAARKPRQFIPPKAAIQLTSRARTFCRELLENTSNPEIGGIMLRFQQSASGEPRMVFSFDFIMARDLGSDDEGVSLEVLEDGTPTPPIESMNDGKRKLYLHQSAILKVMGGTLDIAERDDGSGKDTKVIAPIMYDKEGNEMDPNA